MRTNRENLERKKEGDLAPDFTLSTDKGETFTLSSLRGKKVLLYFYPKAFTSGCTKQACLLRDSYKELLQKGIEVVGVSPDPVETLRKFRSTYHLPFYLLSDPGCTVAKLYGAYGEKKMYGKTTRGIVRSAFLINEEGSIERCRYRIPPLETVSKMVGDKNGKKEKPSPRKA
jgi:peroxiredoxin Q/BCP